MGIPEYLKGKNLFDMAQSVYVWVNDLTNEQISVFENNGFDVDLDYDEDDEEYNDSIMLNLADLDQMFEEAHVERPDFQYYDFDEYYLEDCVKDILDIEADRYLVLGTNLTWDHRDGYKIADTWKDTLYRDYDTSFYPKDSKFGGKVLTATEYSHDVPMGSGITILALTQDEYEAITTFYDDEYDEYFEDDPNPELVDKFIKQGHLDEGDFKY